MKAVYGFVFYSLSYVFLGIIIHLCSCDIHIIVPCRCVCYLRSYP